MARKDSGIDWIGNIPESWIVSKVKYSSTFINGFAFDSNQFKLDGEYSVIRIGDFQDNQIDYNGANKIDDNSNLENYRILGNDILIAMSGATVGKIAYVSNADTPAYINQRVGIIRNDNPNFSSRYIYYSLLSSEFIKYIYYISFGSAQPNVSGDTIMNYYLTFSSIKQQEETTNFLDAKTLEINNLIDNLTNQIDKLKEYKKALITKCVTKGLDANVPLKDSGIDWIGEIPANWNLIKLKFLAETRNEKNNGENFEYVALENIESFSGNYLETDGEYDLSQANVARKDDILFGKLRPYLAKVYLCKKDILAGGEFIVLNPTKISNRYLFYTLLNARFIDYISSTTNGTKMPRTSADVLESIILPVPSIDDQVAIADYLDKKCSEIDALISSKQQQIDKLNEYQKSLIYEYVTGKKEVV